MKLLITGAFHATPEQLDQIASMGHELICMPQESDPLPVDPAGVEGVICNGLFLHHDINRFPSLRFIQLTSAGLDRVPVDRIRALGIPLFNARGVYSIPMAEWTLMRILEYYKDSRWFDRMQQARRWEKRRDLRELWAARAAIIGAGSVGSGIARRLTPFGVEVTGYDIHTNPVPHFPEMRHIDTLRADISRYDIVILTAPLTPATRGLIDRPILEAMRTGAMLVNVARGPLVDQSALADVLTRRPDLYAALDVFDSEPLPAASPLWDLPNVRISPHNSFVGPGNQERLFNVVISNLSTIGN